MVRGERLIGRLAFDDIGESAEGIVMIFVEDAVEGALVEFAVGAPDVIDGGDGFALVVGGDEGFRVAGVVGFVGDDPAVEVAFAGEVEGEWVVVIPDFRNVVDLDEGIAAEGVVFVGGFLEESGWGGR